MDALKKIAIENFKKEFSTSPTHIAHAPGRINIIGEHTDYNFGLSLPAAINRWVVVCGKPRTDKQFKAYSHDFNESFTFEIDKDANLDSIWKKYIYGASQLFFQQNKCTHGLDFYIIGDIPLGSGVSSSAGLTVAIMNFLSAIYNKNESPLNLIKYAQLTEHQYLGVKCGLLDQYASQFSQKGKVMVLDFAIPSHQYFDADFSGYQWVLVDTKVKRQLASSKYTERVDETQKGFETLKNAFPEIKHFRDIQLKYLAVLKDENIKKRIEHYITENQRVLDTALALQQKEMAKVGKLLLDSHQSLQNKYEVSCDELDFLVQTAMNIEGVLGGRMMGGGFGGCTINLVKQSKVDGFKETILKKYKEKFQISGEANVYDIVHGAKGYEI